MKFNELKGDGDLEFVWIPTFATDKGEEKNEILAHALHDHYNPPYFVPSSAYMTGAPYSKNLARSIADQWLSYFDDYLKAYKTRNIIVLWGDDFSHQNAHATYSSLETTIETIGEKIRERSSQNNYILKWSTVGEYLDAVWSDAQKNKITFKEETGDFWAYRHEPFLTHAYWTGYYSTNPDFKASATDFGDFVQSTELLTALSPSYSEDASMFETLSIMQHHDAMTGTHPFSIGQDYLKMIDNEYRKALPALSIDDSKLDDEFRRIAQMFGAKIDGTLVRCQVNDSLSVDCPKLFFNTSSSLLMLHNANVKDQHGLVLSNLPASKVLKYSAQLLTLTGQSDIQVENFCNDKTDGMSVSIECFVYLDVKISGLSTTLIQVQKQEFPSEDSNPSTETIFRSELGLFLGASGTEAMEMADGVSVQVGDQKLTLKKLNDSLSPLILNYSATSSEKDAEVSFSV